MKNVERRTRQALDESYRYYKSLEHSSETAELFKLVKCLQNIQAAINQPNGQFHLTRQLWLRVYYNLFDKLIVNFPGYCLVVDKQGRQVNPQEKFPEEGTLEFHPQQLKRSDDAFSIEIKHLYPATFYALAKAWESRGAMVHPEVFVSKECGPNGCFLKPVLLGDEVLGSESKVGKDTAYQLWWELYWQAYCAADEHEQLNIFHRMHELETVWGNLYY